jgi:hypothetical protein
MMMKRSTLSWSFFVFSAFLSLEGCKCGGTVHTSYGELNVLFTDSTGAMVSATDHGTWDFGAVSMGKTQTLPMSIQNTGAATLTVSTFEKESGDPVVAGTVLVEANPIFTLGFDGPTDVAPGETHDFTLSFAPPIDSTQKAIDYLSLVKLRATSTDPTKDFADLTFKGKGVSGECDLPATIDFGAVALHDTFSQSVTLNNTRPIDTTAFVGDITSPMGAGIFVFTPDSPTGTFPVLAGHMRTVTIQFTPTEAHDYFATVTMRAAEGCPEKPVRLIGTGVAAVLTCAPTTVDFGYTPPGLAVPGQVVCSNQGLKAVNLTGLNAFEGANPSTSFKVTEAQLLPTVDLTKLTIPGATRDMTSQMIVPGTATVKMTFKPTVLGPKSATLRAMTDLSSQTGLAVALKGVGGGPNIQVRPVSPFNFGRIAYFAGATPASFSTRNLTVQNIGTLPNPPDPMANLRLGPNGVGGAGTYWKVVAKNGNTTEAELCLGVYDVNTGACAQDLPTTGPGAYDPAVGLLASGLAAVLSIPVRITPASVGMKEWDVTIYSNDPDQPALTVNITANAEILPACNISVSPLNLGFGVVSPPQTKDLGFTITNNSTTDICVLTNLQLQPESGTPAGMPPIFSLPAGDIIEKELQPLEVMQVITRAWPQGAQPATPATVVGHVQFDVANPNSPQVNVTLTATVGPSCLTIAPSDLDFGTVKAGCSSADRDFVIYNTCSSAVTINSSAMVPGGGVPMGVGGCAGPGNCPEFIAVPPLLPNGTVIAAASSSAAPPKFKIRYHPLNLGPDTGAFVLHVTQGATQVDYVVTLHGVGDSAGLNVDTFKQDAKPKADILLVIDDSGSMSDKQAALGSNLASFLQYARSSQVDFNIAVTNTELTDPTLGDFRTSPGGFTVLKPTTPNLDAEFAQLVQVGLNGGTETCLEGARLALTAPKITAGNAGFLRSDAVLAVVCVSDAGDQGPLPAATYLNTMLAIKGIQHASQFTFNDIGPYLPSPPLPQCGYDNYTDVASYLYMVTSTNGVKEEICTVDWATALQNIGKSAFGFRTNFYLTAHPDPAPTAQPIEVGIDAAPCGMGLPACATGQTCSTYTSRCVLPAVDSRGAPVWTYDTLANSVNFEPLYVPTPGTTLTVSYQVQCLP